MTRASRVRVPSSVRWVTPIARNGKRPTRRSGAGGWGAGEAEGYSYCSALSTSRREARRAGPIAASTPATAATTVKATSEPTGTAKRSPSSAQGRGGEAGQEQADRDPEHRADQRRDDALVADHPPHLAAAHPDRPQHPELARALEHREGQRVHDAEQRDDHGQAEEDVEDPEDLVHPGGLVGLELALRLELHVREGRERLLERRPRRAVRRHERIALALGGERLVVRRPGDRDLARAERVEPVRLRDAGHAQVEPVALDRGDLEVVAHSRGRGPRRSGP